MHYLQAFRKSIIAQNSVRFEFVFGSPCVSAMVTISHQVKIAYGEGGKEWLVPSQFIKDAENCDWQHWFQVRASHPGLAALLFPGFLASNGFGVAIYCHWLLGLHVHVPIDHQPCPGAKRDEVSIPNSNELGTIIDTRNSMQQESSELFEGPGNKKRKFVPAEPDDEVSFVTINLEGLEGLKVKKAKKLRDDLVVPLESDQLKLLFDYLSQQGTSCLDGKEKRSYARTGKFAKSSGHEGPKDDN